MKKDLNDIIEDFVNEWDVDSMCAFLRDLEPIFELYDVNDDETDWIRPFVSDGEHNHVRLIRTVYLVSKFAEIHAGKLCVLNLKYKKLWQKMEKEAMNNSSACDKQECGS